MKPESLSRGEEAEKPVAPPPVQPIQPSKQQLRRAQLAAEEKKRQVQAQVQTLTRSVQSVRDLYVELEKTAEAMQRLAHRFHETEYALRKARDTGLATRIGYRAVCSAVFGSAQLIQTALKYRGRLNSVERDIREELESK